jgi:predicted nucleotide-binding protein
MPYHVRITRKSNTPSVYNFDLTEERLQERVIAPFRDGDLIFLGGVTIPTDDIHRIVVVYTAADSEQLRSILEREIDEGGLEDYTSVADEILVRGEDVTDDVITGPPRQRTAPRSEDQGTDVRDPRRVFVVHGRNSNARDAMFAFLRSINLYPLEWVEAVAETGKASPYVGDVLDAAFSIAQAVVILMTPDDVACLREPFRRPGDPPHETELTPQARPNVLFEAGMAMGRSPDRTVIVELGTLRPFSDVGGRHVIRLDDTTQRRQDLAQRLETAGCPVTLTGTDWHTAGDFALALGRE